MDTKKPTNSNPLAEFFGPNDDPPPIPQKPFFLQDTDTSSPPATPISPPPSDIKDPSSKIQIPKSPIPPPPSAAIPPPSSAVPPPTSNSPFSKSLLLLIIPIVVSTFLISIYYNANQNRQPKTSSRAAQPSTIPQLTTHNLQPTTPISSGGFSSLVSSAPTQPSDSAQDKPTTYNPQLTSTNLQPPTSNQSPPIAGTRISLSLTLEGDAFTPANLEATTGQIISISVIAQDKFYNVAIPDLGLSNTIPKGGSRMMEFQATKAGRYQITSPDSPATATLIIK